MNQDCPGCAAPAAATTAQGDLLVCAQCRGRWVVPGATALSLRTSHGDDPEEITAQLALPPEFRARYELGQVAGSGAMGLVVFAHDRERDEPVAIKFLARMNNPEALDRFVREARALQRVKHPYVVEVRGLDVLGPHPYLVLERVDGGTLRQRLRRDQRLSPAIAGRIAMQVAQGLQAIHTLGIVHRDLKPENLLFDISGHIKLADLGIAADYSDLGTTREGAIIGTPLYMSPEQVRGERPGIAADLYSLGVVLYEMLAGRPPFTGSPKQVFDGHRTQEPPDLEPQIAGLPAGVAALVRRLLAKRPSERPVTADDVVTALSRALGVPPPALPRRVSHRGERPPPAPPAPAPQITPARAGTPAPVAAPVRTHTRSYWECRIAGQRAPVRLGGAALVFGRGFEADVRIVNETVSGAHALLVVDGERLRLTDLRSSAGTLVNGRSVLVAELADLDSVQLGTATMTVHRLPEQVPGPAPDPAADVPPPSAEAGWLEPLAAALIQESDRGAVWSALDLVVAHFELVSAQLIAVYPEDFRVVAWAPDTQTDHVGRADDLELARTAAELGTTTVDGDRLATPLVCRGRTRGALVVQVEPAGRTRLVPDAWPLWQSLAATLALAHDATESRPPAGEVIFEVPTL